MSLPPWLLEHCSRLESKDEELTNLNLNTRKLSDAMMYVLAAAIQQNSHLLVLNLTSSLVNTSNALTVFADQLPDQSSLKVLHLSYNRLENVSSFGRMLERNSSLVEIFLDYNSIEPAAACQLADGLANNGTLQVFRLNSNRIGNEGCQALAEALTENKSLKTLTVSRNHIGSAGADALERSLQKNMTLQNVGLDKNDILPDQESRIQLLCRANRAGRRYLRQKDFAVAIWPTMLAKLDIELFYFFFRAKPDLGRTMRQQPDSNKRKRNDFDAET
jgi:hypothetical protein